MLRVMTTPNHTGLRLCGSEEDLTALCDAVAALLYVEDVREDNDTITRVMSLCYELRQACRGQREYLEGTDGALCCAARLLWPEALFEVFALEDLLRLAEAPCSYLHMGHPALDEARRRQILRHWDETAALLRFFQSLVLAQLKKEIGPARYRRLFKNVAPSPLPDGVLRTEDYCLPYLDQLTVKYLRTRVDRRTSYLATVAERLFSAHPKNQQAQAQAQALADGSGTQPNEVCLNHLAYPDEVVW